MTRRPSTMFAGLVVTAMAGILLAGCDGSDGNTAAPGGSMSSTPTSPGTGSPGSSPSAGPSPNAGGPPQPSGSLSAGGKNGETTLTGDLVEGVEAGCVLLRTADKSYLLVGGDRSLFKQGGRVTVTGKPQPELMTTCQQGEPFQVTQAKRA